MDDAQLRTVWQQRQFRDDAAHLAFPLAVLMEQKLKKRVRQLSGLAQVWDDVIPQAIRDHTALEGFHRGTLTVVVDSSPHRFRLQAMLSGGLLKLLQARLGAALNRVRLVPGQFSSVDLAGHARYQL